MARYAALIRHYKQAYKYVHSHVYYALWIVNALLVCLLHYILSELNKLSLLINMLSHAMILFQNLQIILIWNRRIVYSHFNVL